jgi:hypothetical protein
MTAVEFLVEELIKLGYLHSNDYNNSPMVHSVIRHAKEMEQQQREDSFKEGGEAVSDYLNKEACRQLGILPHTKI